MNTQTSFNLVAISGPLTRRVSLLAALFSGLIWVISKFVGGTIYPEQSFLWLATLAITLANFSDTGIDRKQGMIRRYLAFKGSVSWGIGFLLSLGFVNLMFDHSIAINPLYLALGFNLSVLFLEWSIRWKLGPVRIESERLGFILSEQREIVWLSLVLSLITLIGLLIYYL